jgi:hypothetical protein
MRNHFFPISALIVLVFAGSISAQQQPQPNWAKPRTE